MNTICPRSTYPFRVVTYYVKWDTTSWTHSLYKYSYMMAFIPVIQKLTPDPVPLKIKWIFSMDLTKNATTNLHESKNLQRIRKK